MAVKMLHTCIRVIDLEKSVEFYKKAFDFIETSRKDFKEYEFTLVYLSNEVGGYEIELTYNYNPTKPYEMGTGYSHIAVGAEDIEKMRDNHIKLGYEVTPLKGLADNSAKFYFVTDPDGYKIEVIEVK